MPSTFWKCLFRVSRRPYARPCAGSECEHARRGKDHTQRKNKMVTRQTGRSDARTESSEAVVTWSSRVLRLCFRNMDFFSFLVASISVDVPLDKKNQTFLVEETEEIARLWGEGRGF